MRLIRIAAAVAVAMVVLAPSVEAAPADVPARIPDQSVYDLAGVLSTSTKSTAESILRTVRGATGTDVVVVAETADAPLTGSALTARADALRAALDVGAGGSKAILVLVEVERFGCAGQVTIDRDQAAAKVIPDDAATAIVERDMAPLVAACQLDSALLVGLGRITTALVGGGVPTIPGGPVPSGRPIGEPAVAPGPPFPAPVNGVRVYDTAGAFRPDTIASVAKTIAAIESRTGAQVVVYSQVVEPGRTSDEANADAQALIDQWGVGRKGFDDGLVILFDLYPGLRHGQVSLYGAPGYRAAYLDNGEKQRIFDDDMVPLLKAGDMDGALLVAIQRVDAAATPAHAATLQRARQLDAAIGLIGAPVIFLVLVGRILWSWRRYGRDPVYLDDPSIHMAGPPETLTPSAAVVVLDGQPTRRALTTALIDLASRGVIAFRQESHLLGLKRPVGIETAPAEPDAETLARQRRNAARRLGAPEQLIATRLGAIGDGAGGYIEPDDLPKIAPSVPAFDRALEAEVVRNGWFREAPSAVMNRFRLYAGIELGLGIAGVVAGFNLPSNGVLLIGVSLALAGAASFVVAASMPAVTLPGAMIRAMLAAYRRTLKKTMDAARSMDQVVADAGLQWLETPDQAVVWGLALGLHREIEDVIGRSLEDVEAGRASPATTYLPTWYGTTPGGSAAGFAGVASGGGGGLFSSSAVPDFGGMFAALGTIGNAPSSSGGPGGGGGFGGGGSGGGGGGSGGGF